MTDSPDWTLRALAREDFAWDYALMCAALGPYVTATWGWDEAFQRRHFAQNYPEALKHRQVVEVDGERVGVLTAHQRRTDVYLELLEITPAWQNRGLGSSILGTLMTRAAGLDLPLTLMVLRCNTRARHIYERHGLRVVDDTDPVRVRMSS